MDDKGIGLGTAEAHHQAAVTCATCGRPLTQVVLKANACVVWLALAFSRTAKNRKDQRREAD